MWIFRKKRDRSASRTKARLCPFCGSPETRVDTSGASEGVSPVKAWRGERLISMKCLSCGRVFYAEPVEGDADPPATPTARNSSALIDDEEALRAAEEELKRQTDADDDRRYRGG
jgi:hypothetical protein